MSYDGMPMIGGESVEHLLRVGERVLWQGKPLKGPYVLRTWTMSLFGLFFLAFALFWVVAAYMGTRSASADGGGMGMLFRYALPLFGLPFIAIGCYMAFGHFVKSAIEWKQTLYVLTDQRVILRGGTREPIVATVELTEITGLTVSGTAVGDLVFDMPDAMSVPEARRIAVHARRRGMAIRIAPTFEKIANPGEVYRLAEDALQRARRGK